MSAPLPKRQRLYTSGRCPGSAASVMDQAQGQNSSHVPIGAPSRASFAYGTALAGNQRSHGFKVLVGGLWTSEPPVVGTASRVVGDRIVARATRQPLHRMCSCAQAVSGWPR
eukprot:scaffold1798_cov376-Prasinococcus_capsulatus_cf.AAC.4